MKSKSTQNKTAERAFINMLMTSVFSILLAMTFLASSTWAWFSTEVSPSTPSTIQSSSYHVTVLEAAVGSVAVDKEKTTNGNLTEYLFFNNADKTLTAGTYTFTVEAEGTGRGYCKVLITTTQSGGSAQAEEILFTKEIPAGEAYTFQVTLENAATVKVIPVWGSYSGTGSLNVEKAAASN